MRIVLYNHKRAVALTWSVIPWMICINVLLRVLLPLLQRLELLTEIKKAAQWPPSILISLFVSRLCTLTKPLSPCLRFSLPFTYVKPVGMT